MTRPTPPAGDPAARIRELEAEVEGLRDALEPFARIGQWLFARPQISDSEPMVTLTGLHRSIALTRGDFKRAHTAVNGEALAANEANARAALKGDQP